MKRVHIIPLVFAIVFLSGCAPVPAQQSRNGSETACPEEPVQTVVDICEILSSASKGAGSPLAEMGGFADTLEAIKEKGENAASRSEAILAEEGDGSVLTGYADELSAQRDALADKLSEIKLAKQEKDIEAIRATLSEMENLIDQYAELLSDIEEEMWND